MPPGAPSYPEGFFDRADESDDAAFYAVPRLVAHIDDATIAALTAFYRERIPAGGRVLDLMSSWISHLPEDVDYADVAVLGMNEAELRANPRATRTLVHDLNANPGLPYPEASFDAALCAVSVQYLTRPHEVFAEVGRVLAPGGEAIVAMSHRCFPTKAIRAFHVLGREERMRVVAGYFAAAGGFEPAECLDRSPAAADPLWLVVARRAG